MKNIIFGALAPLLLVNTSCNRDQESNNKQTLEQKLAKKWLIKSETFSYADKTKSDYTIRYDDDCSNKSYWNFSDKKLEIKEFKKENNSCQTYYTGFADFKISDNTIIYQITDTDEIHRFKIKEISDKQLILEEKTDHDIDNIDDLHTVVLYR